MAAGRPRGRKKKNVEEQPIASPSVKQCRKSVTSPLESPQIEPVVETPPLNEAHVETQMPEPPTDVTPSRPQRLVAAGRPRGRKKKNVEEQPIASPSVKQCRRSATSDLESPQEEPAVETPPLNEAHVETQMPQPPTDVTPSRLQRLVAAGRPRGRKKKNVEEQPIASPSVKQCRKSATSDLESPQEEPAVETPPLNEAHVETQMPQPPTDVTPSRPQRLMAAGRPRGRKKKNVEEQPIASPSVKQCRRSATSDLESPQEEPAVETPPLNEAHVETQMPQPPTDVTPSRPQRLVAAGRPRGRKKKNVEEQPIASPSVKQCRKSATSDLESPQEEPAVETPPLNEAHVETQMPQPPTDVTPSRPQRLVAAGRPRGRKKKNVEEQPIASPSVKQCRRSATSDLESPQEEPAVETPPLNEAHVETQMPQPPTDVTPSRPQRLVAAGRPRGRKKKNVEEQPIASPSVKHHAGRVQHLI